MPYICEHCHKSFSAKCSLNRHQTTALFCLDIQRTNGLQVVASEYKCNCGSIFTQKAHLKRHEEKCSSSIQNNQIINAPVNGNVTQNITQNIQNNFNINVTYSMGNLTTEHIISTLKPILTTQVLKSGMSAVTDIIIDVLLQQDGKYIYYCSDRSRKEFKMLLDHKGEIIEKADPDAIAMRRVLHAPLCELISKLMDGNKDKSIESTVDQLKNLKVDGKKFTNEMACKLPRSPDGIPDELAELFEDSDKFAAEYEERQKLIDNKRLLEDNKEKKLKTKTSVNDMLDNCIQRHIEGNYWHKINHWVVELDSNHNPIILGYAQKITDKRLNLTKAQIQTIIALGLEKYLDRQYQSGIQV